jgi:hypothetical protein
MELGLVFESSATVRRHDLFDGDKHIGRFRRHRKRNTEHPSFWTIAVIFICFALHCWSLDGISYAPTGDSLARDPILPFRALDELTGLITQLAIGGLLHASAPALAEHSLHTGEVEGSILSARTI